MNDADAAPQEYGPRTSLGTVAIVAALLRAYATGRKAVPAPIAAVLAHHLDSASLAIGRALLRVTPEGKRGKP
jgi:hypothetical protein